MRLITEEEVRRVVESVELVAAIREAFTRDFRAAANMPVRSSLPLAGGAVLLWMPCHVSFLGLAGAKTVTVSRACGVNATYELFDPETGKVLARIEANYLTDVRTAATSAVATELLAPAGAETLGIYGLGRQAIAHLTVLPVARLFKRLLVCGRSYDGRSDVTEFCKKMKNEHGITAEPADAESCASQSDIICTCTTSPTPVLEGRWLRPGTHLNLVGAFQPETREVDGEAVRRSRVVVDTYEGALTEAGDVLIPLNDGTIARNQIVADLHEIASGKKHGRIETHDITLFKSVGCALEDLVAAKMVYERVSS